MPVPTLPSALADGSLALGSEVRANDDAIVAVLDHGLDRDNFLASGANVPATVLSTTAGERVPTNRIEDDAVTADKLKDDATAGSPGAAVATANHVKDGILNGKKLVNATVGADKFKLGYYDLSGLSNLPGGGANSSFIGRNTTNTIPLCIVTMLNGVPSTTTAAYNTTIHVHTGTGNIYLVVNNTNDTTTISFAGITLRMYYLEIAST